MNRARPAAAKVFYSTPDNLFPLFTLFTLQYFPLNFLPWQWQVHLKGEESSPSFIALTAFFAFLSVLCCVWVRFFQFSTSKILPHKFTVIIHHGSKIFIYENEMRWWVKGQIRLSKQFNEHEKSYFLIEFTFFVGFRFGSEIVARNLLSFTAWNFILAMVLTPSSSKYCCVSYKKWKTVRLFLVKETWHWMNRNNVNLDP